MTTISTDLAPPPDALRLRRLAELATDFGDAGLARQALDLAGRVAEGRIFVACVGQFKRGKSTLLDALSGDRLLPVGVIPVTSVPTVIRFGPERRARLRRRGGEWEAIPLVEVASYVTQEHNPDNQKGVDGVEIFTPAPLLASGLCLVDTPGLGSVFASNTESARAFIPHLDAALVVFGADPPLSGAELDMVAEVAVQVPDLIFVLNKADRVLDSDREAAAAFSRRVLEQRLQRGIGPIFQVSALEQAQGRERETPAVARDWPALVEALQALGAQSRLRGAAAARGLHRLGRHLAAAIALERDALQRPLQESEERMASLRQTLAAAERSRADLGALLASEQMRLSRHFGQRRKQFLAQCHTPAQAELRTALRALPRHGGPAFRLDAMRTAQEVARRCLLPWLAAEEAEGEQEFRRTMTRFTELGRNFLRGADLAAAADDLSEPGLRAPSRFYFCDFTTLAQPASPLRYLLDAALGLVRAYGPIAAAAARFLDLLLDTNAARVQSDLDQRVSDSRQRLEADLRALLAQVAEVSERALRRAREAQQAGAPAVATALARLSTLAAALAGLTARAKLNML